MRGRDLLESRIEFADELHYNFAFDPALAIVRAVLDRRVADSPLIPLRQHPNSRAPSVARAQRRMLGDLSAREGTDAEQPAGGEKTVSWRDGPGAHVLSVMESESRARSQSEEGGLSVNPKGWLGSAAAPRVGADHRSTVPIRPQDWRERPCFTGELELRLRASGRSTFPGATVTLARTHRPYKARETHVERTQVTEDANEHVVFGELAAGDYLVIVRTRGNRPIARALQFSRSRRLLELELPLLPADSAEDEDVLLRPGERHPNLENVRRFLLRFGYAEQECGCARTELCDHLGSALRLFQQFHGQRRNGALTVATLVLMLRPRCAVPDIRRDRARQSSAGPTGIAAQDPIAFTGNRWDNHSLRYRLFDGSNDLANEWDLVRAALGRWASASPLTFREVTEAISDLEFDFRRPAEPGYPFDGGGNKDGNVLAHAWGPSHGTVEFDDHEDWGSTNLAAVSTHEIGHALGLDHSSVDSATMYPWYDSGQASLHEVDVRGIKSLYAPVFSHGGPFVVYPLYAFQSTQGTDSVTIDLGTTRHFLAWGTITMIDSLNDLDRDNMSFIDVYEVDGSRTSWQVSGGDHYGSSGSPGNAFEGCRVGFGRRITFRITAANVNDLEVSGFALVLVLS